MKNETDEMEGQQKLTPLDLDISEIGEIELPSIDVTKYIGKKVKIVSVKPFISAKFNNPVLQVVTETVETIERKDGKKPIEIKGSRLFGLYVNDDGKTGYGPKTKLGIFMAKYRAKTPDELIGKTVVLQSQTTATGNEFLSFN